LQQRTIFSAPDDGAFLVGHIGGVMAWHGHAKLSAANAGIALGPCACDRWREIHGAIDVKPNASGVSDCVPGSLPQSTVEAAIRTQMVTNRPRRPSEEEETLYHRKTYLRIVGLINSSRHVTSRRLETPKRALHFSFFAWVPSVLILPIQGSLSTLMGDLTGQGSWKVRQHALLLHFALVFRQAGRTQVAAGRGSRDLRVTGALLWSVSSLDCTTRLMPSIEARDLLRLAGHYSLAFNSCFASCGFCEHVTAMQLQGILRQQLQWVTGGGRLAGILRFFPVHRAPPLRIVPGP